MSFAELLTQEQVQRIHDASLEILEEVGFMVRYEPARKLFASHGCTVDTENNELSSRVLWSRSIAG